MDPMLAIEVERLPGDRYRLVWQPEFATREVIVYGGPAPEAIDYQLPLAREAHATFTYQASTSPHYFALQVVGEPPLVVGARHLALEGATNLRDLGGYAAADGRRIRWGRLFRSGHLARLADSSQRNLAELGINTVCDFRVDEERAHEHLTLPHRPNLVTLNIPPGIGDRHYFHRLFAQTDDVNDVTAAIHAMLRGLVLNLSDSFRQMFDALLAAPPGGMLFNCSAGKERTGTGMVFLLSALGVPRATIKHDFLLSQRYFPAEREVPRVLKKYAVPTKTDAQLRPLIQPILDTPASYVEAIFSAIDELAPTSEAFLASHLGMTRERCAALQDRYLQ